MVGYSASSTAKTSIHRKNRAGCVVAASAFTCVWALGVGLVSFLQWKTSWNKPRLFSLQSVWLGVNLFCCLSLKTSQRMAVSPHGSSFIFLHICRVQRAGNSKVFSKQAGRDVAERSDSALYKRPLCTKAQWWAVHSSRRKQAILALHFAVPWGEGCTQPWKFWSPNFIIPSKPNQNPSLRLDLAARHLSCWLTLLCFCCDPGLWGRAVRSPISRARWSWIHSWCSLGAVLDHVSSLIPLCWSCLSYHYEFVKADFFKGVKHLYLQLFSQSNQHRVEHYASKYEFQQPDLLMELWAILKPVICSDSLYIIYTCRM